MHHIESLSAREELSPRNISLDQPVSGDYGSQRVTSYADGCAADRSDRSDHSDRSDRIWFNWME